MFYMQLQCNKKNAQEVFESKVTVIPCEQRSLVTAEPFVLEGVYIYTHFDRMSTG